MARAITSPELTLLRSFGETIPRSFGPWTELFMAVLHPNTIYTARLASLPSSNDQVAQISYNTGSGTLGDVKPGMTLLVGTTAGARDLGICRIRTAPDGGYFYIGETSEIEWSSNCYLTISDDFDIHARHIHVDDDEYLYMDYNVVYSDQHLNFDPVPVLGSHACLWLSGGSASVIFNSSDSWVFDSTISGHAWEAPGSSSSSGMSTATPTISYNAAGVYRVMCTVTAANGKTAMGVRYVFVFDDDHMPSTVFQIANCEGNVDMGGWMFDVTMQAEASLTDLREGTLVVLFAKDYYQGTEQSIGPIEGRENIVCVGRVGPSESIRWDPVAGQVHFIAYGPQFWLNKIKVGATQLDFTSGSPANWNQVKNLTPDRALWHLMHWRSTATMVMDFYPTGDALYDNRITSLANFLWAQLTEFAGLKLMAHVLCDRFGRLFAEIDPQMVPESGRGSFPEVMEITKDDWMEVIEFERATVHETGQVNISTRFVNSSGTSYTFYSLSPGHMPKRYGEWEINDGMLAASQADSNRKAGLLLGWKNNELPDMPIKLWGNNRMIDITPHQVLAITIAAGDTPRGLEYAGNLIPRRVTFRYDAEARWLSTELGCEAETFEQVVSEGDIPGSGDVDPSVPPLPPLPDLPDLPPIIPGGPGEPSATGPTVAVIHDANVGFMFSTNFNESSPTWQSFNAGLTVAQYQSANRFFRTPNGACYCAYILATSTSTSGPGFVAYAPSLGGTWTVIYDASNLSSGTNRWGIFAISYNPSASETVGIIIANASDSTPKMYVGSRSTFSIGAAVEVSGYLFGLHLSYGLGKWMLTGYDHVKLVSPDGASVSTPAASASNQDRPHVRASTTGKTFHPPQSGNHFYAADNNFATRVDNTPAATPAFDDAFYANIYFACDPTGQYMMTRYTGKGRSSDYGTTWVGIPNLPVGGWWFDYAGPGESTPRFVAAGGSSIRYSPNFGESWLNREGNVTGLAPIPSINMIKVLVW